MAKRRAQRSTSRAPAARARSLTPAAPRAARARAPSTPPSTGRALPRAVLPAQPSTRSAPAPSEQPRRKYGALVAAVAAALVSIEYLRAGARCPPLPPGAVVLLTGASSGIGAELAVQLGARGANLVLAARRAPELAAVAVAASAAGAASVLAIPTDMADARAVASLVEDAAAAHGGRINVLLLNHAAVDEGLIASYGTGLEGTAALDAALSGPLRANTVGSALAAAAALPALEAGHGHIAIVSSASAKVPAPFRAGYVASKAALGGLFGVLTAELHLLHSRVTVGVLILGMVATPGVTRDPAAAAMAASVPDVAAEILCAIGRRDAEAYVPSWYRYWTYATQIGGTRFAEWAMNENYIFKVPRFVEAINRFKITATKAA